MLDESLEFKKIDHTLVQKLGVVKNIFGSFEQSQNSHEYLAAGAENTIVSGHGNGSVLWLHSYVNIVPMYFPKRFSKRA